MAKEDPLAELLRIQERLREVMAPFIQIKKHVEEVIIPRLPEFISDAQAKAKSFQESMVPHLETMTRVANNCHKLEAAGFLPHHTTPLDILDHIRDSGTLSEYLEKYYRDEWTSIRDAILIRLEGYDVDDEAKSTFREALHAHEVGLYRCVCRVLFPEIERVARIEIHDGKLENIASQHDLQRLAGYLDTFQTEPRGMYTLELYGNLTDHLYTVIKTPEAVAKAEADCVPNRHAVVHGIITYASFKTASIQYL